VDHLEASGDAQIKALAKSRTVATLLPGVTLHLGLTAAPGRALIDAGAAVAIGTDLNPGSSPLFSIQQALALSIRLNGLTPKEALTACTVNAATVALCPTTEASLGDGFFPFTDYLQHGGRFGVGSDSQVCVNPWEELRLIETLARLQRRQRNLSALEGVSSGERLLREATATGHVLEHQHGLAVGASADLITFNHEHPLLGGLGAASMLDTLTFASSEGMIDQVMAGGVWRVKEGKHLQRQDEASAAFARLRGGLAARLSD
jgi:cytosine/adenosine deaminase-related metal-dependent hydrolase